MNKSHNKTHHKVCLALLLLFWSIGSAAAQKSNHKALLEGNQAYKEGNYTQAEAEYARALEAEPNSVKGHYNRGNAIYKGTDGISSPEERKERMEKATDAYLNAIQNSKDARAKSKAYYNLGNAYVEQEKYKEGVDAYKQSLRINPKDMDAKANLQRALVQMKQQQQQQQQQNSDSEGEPQESQNQQQQEADAPEGEQDPKEEENPGQTNENENQKPEEQAKEGQQQGQPSPEELSKEEVLRQLKVMDEEEKKVLEKLRREDNGEYPSDKDW